MNKMEVEIISKEFIKPSPPTPSHLRHLQFSFLDQIQPQIFMPTILFYPKNPNIDLLDICNNLKRSLSDVLTIFYPVAGRIRNNSYVDCNDEGVLFVEAKVNRQMWDILRDRNTNDNNYFTPYQNDEAADLGGVFQITFFTCGGFALSFAVSHKLGDALSMTITFPHSWAMLARGNTKIGVPSFGFASYFPPIDRFEPRTIASKEKLLTKFFVFDGSTIRALKAKYTINGMRPTRVEALVAFIVSRFMASTRITNKRSYQVTLPLNIRSRMEPPLPELSFGNLVSVVVAEANIDPKDNDCHGILKSMKDSTTSANAEYVKRLQNTDELPNFLSTVKKYEYEREEKVSFIASSLFNFPLHEIDFGWGKPLSIGLTPMVTENIICLLPTRDGDGMEVCICLKEEDMAKFEMDDMLLAHVSSYATFGAQSRL